ncbi:hypothetical protein NL53_05010 [Vibrio variabilis]|uniref:NAD-dependent epimerase/dehydratase domain-containing protein n=2 Tax=Vibrio variabilis TaxID=990271 RepID=A0ABR4YDY3_9VIBR|nr:hypothetical protein NL53_05010 [Vibrio variabilis]
MSFEESKILITGSTGYIGKNVQKGFVNRCLNYDVLVNKFPFEVDFELNFEGYSFIIHAAGLAHGNQKSVEHSYNVNYKFPLELAKIAKRDGIKCFIFLSSASLYTPKRNGLLSEGDPIAAKNFLLQHKLRAENELLQMSTTNFSVVILRLPLVYSLDAPANFSKLIRISLLSKVQPFGLANNKKSYLSVDNLVDALAAVVLSNNRNSGVYNLTDNRDLSLRELVALIRKSNSLATFHIPIPIHVFYLFLRLLKREDLFSLIFREHVISCKKFMSYYNWKPKVTPEDTLNIERNSR